MPYVYDSELLLHGVDKHPPPDLEDQNQNRWVADVETEAAKILSGLVYC